MNEINSLNRRVEIWGRVKAVETNEDDETIDVIDELGQNDFTDTKLVTVWAGVIPRTGSLLTARPADTILSKTTHKIIIRYSAYKDLSIKNWIIYQGHRFNIDYILNPYFKNEFLEIFCNEVI